ncbi:MAG TPA: alpha/beta hydrolase [Streptosporangiaceae bacterium]|nr:alpha/beta hydrolase [Streptosporangiaceae bacterium]
MNHKIMASKVVGRRSLSRVVRRWVLICAQVVAGAVQVPRQRAAAQTEREPIIAAVGSVSLTKLLIVRDEHGYSSARLPLYFEWHGKSPGSQPPLLLLHGGGSTIESNWGRLIPALESSRRMLAAELQGHGRTGSGDQAASFEGSADGVAALLEELSAGPVDVLGFSNGGQVGMQLAIRHPRAVRRLIVASAPFRRDGMVDGFWPALAAATYADLPEPYRQADLAVSGDPAHAQRMFHLDRELMLTGFADWPDSLVASVAAPALVVAADRDVIGTEHAALLASLIPNARLLVVPGNHGDYLGELVAAAGDPGPLRRALPFLLNFLDQPEITTQS